MLLSISIKITTMRIYNTNKDKCYYLYRGNYKKVYLFK